MFSQKKKKSKGWLIFVPFMVIFMAGIWINSFMGDDSSSIDNENDTLVSTEYSINDLNTNKSNQIPTYEYDNSIDVDEDNEADGDDKEKSSNYYGNKTEKPNYMNEENSTENNTENAEKNSIEGSLNDYFLIISENKTVFVREFSDGKLVSEEITEIMPDALPQYDRESLENGMIFLTQDEVNNLLENFEG